MDGWSTPRLGRFTAGKDPVPTVQEAGWAPGPVWTGADPRTAQPVASLYTDWAIPTHQGNEVVYANEGTNVFVRQTN
jgi:hypothetical protein